MNLLKKNFAQDWEDLPAVEAEGKTEKAEAMPADSAPLVLDIEGIEADPVPAEPAPLSIEEVESGQEQPNQDDALIRELHALLDGITGEAAPAPAQSAPGKEAAKAPEPSEKAPAQAQEKTEVPAAAEKEPAPAKKVPAAAEKEPAPAKKAPAAAAPAPKEAATADPAASDPAVIGKEQNAVSGDALTSVSFASVAEAALRKQGQEEPVQSKTRAPIDDETLLAELYALMGTAPKTEQTPFPGTGTPAASQDKPQNNPPQPEPQRGITDVERPEPISLDSEEEQVGGAPGWVKGAFLLMLSLLLTGMTFYAVASDLLGKLF